MLTAAVRQRGGVLSRMQAGIDAKCRCECSHSLKKASLSAIPLLDRLNED
jgi:hypothetical protein